MKFDPTVSWSVIIGLIGLLISIVGANIAAWILMNKRVGDMELKLELVFDWWRRMWEPSMPIPPVGALRRRAKTKHDPDHDEGIH